MNENNQEELNEIFRKYIEHTIIQRYTTFVELNKLAEKGGIVFVGDSITEGFNIHELLKSDKPMFNRGIGGDTTEGVLAKLKDEVFDLEPTKVFLLIGTNDLGMGNQPEEIVQNIVELCTRIKETLPETELYVESIYPVNPTEKANKGLFAVVGLRTNEVIQQLNYAIRDLASSKQFIYIDLYDKLIDEEGLLNPSYTYDGLHLNTKGYEVVKTELQLYM
jgi:lysophospholipase L1-like esterase